MVQVKTEFLVLVGILTLSVVKALRAHDSVVLYQPSAAA